ncbi:hypothetical protein ACFE04_013777 [Oxalis oulophora]
MEQQVKLVRKAIQKNCKNNPKLAWHLFKRIITITNSSPSTTTTHHHQQQQQQLFLRSTLPIISRLLIASKMYQQLNFLHQFLITSQQQFPHQSTLSSLYYLVTLLAHSGVVDSAFTHFQSIRNYFPHNPPSICLYNVLFNSSIQNNRLHYILCLYKDMLASALSPQTYTFNLFIRALCHSGHFNYAREMFDKMPQKDLGCPLNQYTFAILAKGYCRAGMLHKGFELLEEMRTLGFPPNKVVYNTLISSFSKDNMTQEAENLVQRMRDDGLLPDVVTFNSRISALLKNGDTRKASRIFQDMQTGEALGLPRPNTITYNLMLRGFCKKGMLDEAKSLIDSMKQKRDDMINLESYNIWLLGLVRNGKLLEVQSMLKEMLDKGLEPSHYTYNILVDGLCRNGLLSDARSVMGLMISTGVCPDTATYTTLLHGYCKKGKVLEANNILNEMINNNCLPNTYTCNILLHSLWKEGKTSEAENLLQKMNERGYRVDTVTCNIVIDALCNSGKLDKAVEIAYGMWTHGSAALGNLGNSFIGLVDDSTNTGKKCMPDLVTYSTIISALCKAGRLDEGKKKFLEMMVKNIQPDSAIYDTFIYSYCKEGKMSSAFRVLKDMEKKGYNKSLQTYNSLISGLGKQNQIFEIYGLINEMKERGISPDVCTYNNLIQCLCEGGKCEETTFILDEMLQKGIFPNMTSFRTLIRAFCQTGEFRLAHEVFEIALSICGHKETLYSLMFNELLLGGEIMEAKEILDAAIDRFFNLENFLYKDLVDKLCKEENFEDASHILNKMIEKDYGFDPAIFMPVIDCLSNKQEADKLAEKMMQMTSEGRVTNKVFSNKEVTRGKQHKNGRNDWQTIVHRDDGSGVALKAVKRVQKGWGHGDMPSSHAHKKAFVDYWEHGS